MNGVEDYRSRVTAGDLVSTRVRLRETDLLIRGERDLEQPAREALKRYRREIEDYLFRHPEWGRSLVPVPARGKVPPIAAAMARAAAVCGVGPMAAVAGALAWFVGRSLSSFSGELIVENGGDIFLNSRRGRTVLVGIGLNSEFPGDIGIRIPGGPEPVGVAASSGGGGRSLSWGRAEVSAVLAEDSIVADAAATALGNRSRYPGRESIEAAVGAIADLPGVKGCLTVCGNLLAVRGDLELADLS